MIFTPYVLLISLPRCADRLIDFFREFTVHVDGLGHVCSFAVFDFTRAGKNTGYTGNQTIPEGQTTTAAPGAPETANLREDHYATKQNKMYASYLGFLDEYGTYHGRGAGSKSHHRNFHLPPAWPNMLSPKGTHVMDFGMPHHLRQSMTAMGMTPAWGRQSLHGRASRVGPQNHVSPMHSILLDPHNQPPSAHHPHRMTSPRQAPQSAAARFRSRQHPVSDMDEVIEGMGNAHPRPTTSRILEEDSELGDSWRTDKAADVDEDMGGAPKNAEAPGVLGMLMGFQKAHAEGRGVGI